MSDWSAGEHLKNGRYEIESIIGIGGFGATYRARDLYNDSLVAIKTLNSTTQNHPDFHRLQESFVNEAIALASCRHPNIVRVFPQLFQEGRLWCMVMEYVAGESLSDRCKRVGGLPVSEALAILIPIGKALAFVHQQGFLHRDVKPQNILLRRDSNEPVLIDFGLAREFRPGQIDNLTNHVTDCFAPIEQYSRVGRYGAWTDVYALAATLYVTLTGELPVPARFRRQGAPLVPPSRHNPLVAAPLERAILLGMALEPEERPQSVATWLEYLQPGASLPELPPSAVNLAGGRPTTTGSTPPTDRAGEIDQQTAIVRPRLHQRSQRTAPRVTQMGDISSAVISTARRTAAAESRPASTFDYGTLRRHLLREDWAAANTETYQFMLCLAGRAREGWFRAEDLACLPCADLLAIDRLWLECSDGHFGFTVQWQIYRSLSQELYNLDAWRALGNRLGWRARGDWLTETDLTLDRQAPRGHLPGWILRSEYRHGGLVVFSSLVSRLEHCQTSGGFSRSAASAPESGE